MFGKKNNYLKEIITTLNDNSVDYIICGGVALVLHGVERMTMDLDLSVGMDEGNLRRFLHAMRKLGLAPRAPVPAESILDGEKRRAMVDEKNAVVFSFFDTKNPFRQVDVFITDRFSYEKLKDHAETMSVGPMKIRLVSKKKLLEMKKAINPPRDKDLFDIRLLEKIIEKGRE
ncbi:MAG TPA: hypothetical protein PKX40_17755 [Spirochaetota bacterium]|nr:hypothetical protein [Spirochaetota bacterium]